MACCDSLVIMLSGFLCDFGISQWATNLRIKAVTPIILNQVFNRGLSIIMSIPSSFYLLLASFVVGSSLFSCSTNDDNTVLSVSVYIHVGPFSHRLVNRVR